MSDIELKQLKIKVIPVFEKYGVSKAAIFGSRANGTSKSSSDYDLLVEFLPESKVGLFKFQSLEKKLESALESKVDLTTPNALNTMANFLGPL